MDYRQRAENKMAVYWTLALFSCLVFVINLVVCANSTDSKGVCPELSAVLVEKQDTLCYKECTDEDKIKLLLSRKLKDNEVCCFKTACCKDYTYNVRTKTCIPRCRNKCTNGGKCIAPDTCECPAGLVPTGKYLNKCETPVCHIPCVNAECTGHDECTCFPKHQRLNSTYCCGEGYENKNDQCIPICEEGCKNGRCTSPNTCVCDMGYTMFTDSECVPVCTSGCVNAKCTGPELCTCNDGYEKKSANDTFCTKPCDGSCLLGKCTEHGECICDFGYVLLNGTCTAISVDCSVCEYDCSSGDCRCNDKRPCTRNYTASEVNSTGLASVQLSWIVGSAVGLLLIVLLLVVMYKHWQKRKMLENKTEQYKGEGHSSVIFTVPDTLIQHNIPDNIDEEPTDNAEEAEDPESAINKLLTKRL